MSGHAATARRRFLGGAGAAALLAAFGTRAAGAPRVVTVGGALTEIVYRLNAAKLLVATDTTSTYPPAAVALPKVGYQRSLSAEGLLALGPTLLLAGADAGPHATLEQLAAAGVRIVRTRGDHTFEALVANVGKVAESLDRKHEGETLRAILRKQWAQTQQAIRRKGAAPRALFVLSHAANSVQVAGEGTAADAMIRYAGGVNALSGFAGYRPLSSEFVIAAAPDLIVCTREGIATLGGVDALLKRPGLALTPAGRERRVLAPDALYLLGFGPRLPEAVRGLAQGFGTLAAQGAA